MPHTTCLIAECPSCRGLVGSVLEICTNADRIARAWEHDGLVVSVESVSRLQLLAKGHGPGCARGRRINAEWRAKLEASPTRNKLPVETWGDLPALDVA